MKSNPAIQESLDETKDKDSRPQEKIPADDDDDEDDDIIVVLDGGEDAAVVSSE